MQFQVCLIFSTAFLRFISGLGETTTKPCKSRDYGNGSPVCVCDSAFCDTIAPIEPLGENQAVVFVSDKSGRRLERSIVEIRSKYDGEIANVTVDPSHQYQSIEGFGGAFTDAAGINIASLPQAAQENLLKSYFGGDGIEYNIGRVPISSCDFSVREYSYDDVPNDFELKHFALAEEDLKYKIPYINLAQSYSTRPFRLFGSSWSAPAWMKTNSKMESNGTLKGDPKPGDPYYTTWATYYVRFLQEYGKHNLTFWALTGQNEPTTGFLYNYSFQTQGFTADMQRQFIKHNLGPALHQNGFQNVGIMILDDNRHMLPSWARTAYESVLRDPDARKYVSHIAVHFYFDRVTPTYTLDNTHKEFPDISLFGSEACIIQFLNPGEGPDPVVLGSWERAEHYARDIIEDLNHWFVGWVDWNIALNPEGGPNWVKNFVDSPIIVNASAGEFYKQPMFYIMGHFSKFLPPKSIRIGSSNVVSKNIEVTTFLNADGYKTVIMMNKGNAAANLSLTEKGANKFVDVYLPARSIVTILWK